MTREPILVHKKSAIYLWGWPQAVHISWELSSPSLLNSQYEGTKAWLTLVMWCLFATHYHCWNLSFTLFPMRTVILKNAQCAESLQMRCRFGSQTLPSHWWSKLAPYWMYQSSIPPMTDAEIRKIIHMKTSKGFILRALYVMISHHHFCLAENQRHASECS